MINTHEEEKRVVNNLLRTKKEYINQPIIRPSLDPFILLHELVDNYKIPKESLAKILKINKSTLNCWIKDPSVKLSQHHYKNVLCLIAFFHKKTVPKIL